MSDKTRILFVCMGNICRSPAGEGVFRHFVEERGIADRFYIESAGTISYHIGEPPDARMCRAAKKRGYQLDGQARHFTPKDFEDFDLIVAMDTSNKSDILSLANNGPHRDKVFLLCDFHPETELCDVPDPYYGGERGFEEVLDLIEGACEGILAHLEEKERT